MLRPEWHGWGILWMGGVNGLATRTLSTHGRSNNNVDVVSARSVFRFWVWARLGLSVLLVVLLCLTTHPTFIILSTTTAYLSFVLAVVWLFCFYLTSLSWGGEI